MMDRQCINAIVKVILESNMADLNFRNVDVKPITCETNENGTENYTVHTYLYSPMDGRTSLSEAWATGNLLLFSVFDGYLETPAALIGPA